MTLPNRARAWKTTITAVSGTPSSTQTFTLGRTNGMPTLPATICVVKRGQDANPGTHEEIYVTAMSGSQVTACTRASNGTTAISLEVGDGVWQSVAAILDAIESAIGSTYVVDGVAYAATRAGIQAAVTAASAAGGGHVIIARDITLDTTPVSMPAAGNVEISALPGCVLSGPTSGVVVGLFQFSGTKSAESTIATTISRRARSVNHNQTGGLTFARGDYIRLLDPVTFQEHQSRVVAVSGAAPQTVTFSEPTSVSFTTGDVCTVAKVTPIPGIYVHDIAFDNNSNTSAVVACYSTYTVSARWERLSFTGFKGSGLTGSDTAGGFSCEHTYKTTVRDLDLYDCGSLQWAAVHHTRNTRMYEENYNITACGFAYVDATGSNHFTKKSIHASYCGEGIGLGANTATDSGINDGTVEDCWGHHITAGGTGFRVRGGTKYVEFNNCGAYDCDSDGIFIAGLTIPEHHLLFNNCRFEGNGITTGVDVDLAAFTTPPYAIEFRNTTYGTRTDNGIGTIWNGGLLVAPGTPTSGTTRTAILSKALYAGQITIYNGIEGKVVGTITNTSGSNVKYTFELQIGSTAGIVKQTGNIASGATYPFELTFSLRNAGVTNSQLLEMTATVGVASASGTGTGSLASQDATFGPQPLTGTAAEDTTTALTLAVYATSDTAANNAATPTQEYLRVVG